LLSALKALQFVAILSTNHVIMSINAFMMPIYDVSLPTYALKSHAVPRVSVFVGEFQPRVHFALERAVFGCWDDSFHLSLPGSVEGGWCSSSSCSP
jgi:hypothetical protein